MKSLEPIVSKFLNDQEEQKFRKTWTARVAKKWIYFYRESWKEDYRLPRFRQPIFYIVIANYLDSPTQIECASRFEHTLLERDNCPKVDQMVVDYFDQHGIERIVESVFPQAKRNSAKDIGFVNMLIPNPFLIAKSGGRLELNVDANITSDFARQIMSQSFSNNQPLLDFLGFIKINNI